MKKILFIDDDIFFQKFYTTKLTENGFEVTVAANGKEGLEKMQQNTYDLVLLDMVMPEMDGFDVLKVRSENVTLKKIPVIVFSTLVQNEDIEKVKSLGADEYLNKSFYNFDKVLEKINTCIQ